MLMSRNGQGPKKDVPEEDDEDDDDEEDEDEDDEDADEGEEPSEADTSDSKSESHHDDSEEYEQLFAAVMTAKDGDRNICEIFKLLPSRSVCSWLVYGCSVQFAK
jgi:hypothetical protein